MLRPHPPGTICRLRDEGKFDCEVHEEYHYADGTILACKYCRWEAGKYDGRNYIRDPISGWWETDPGICRCIYFGHCGGLFLTDKTFFVAGTLRLHRCDIPRKHGVQDFDDCSWMWKYVITVGACRRIFSGAINHWRCRKHEKNKDALGFFLSMREWVRLRRCAGGLNQNIITNASFHGTAWRCVNKLFTYEQQLRHDAVYAHTIEYPPIGAIVKPTMTEAPSNVEAAKWVWAEIRLPMATRSRHGWIHPDIIAK